MPQILRIYSKELFLLGFNTFSLHFTRLMLELQSWFKVFILFNVQYVRFFHHLATSKIHTRPSITLHFSLSTLPQIESPSILTFIFLVHRSNTITWTLCVNCDLILIFGSTRFTDMSNVRTQTYTLICADSITAIEKMMNVFFF